MDEQQRLVPLGVSGELVVTGDGLARGYTDLKQNRDRFIMITLGSKQVQAYRTGDLVRYRPKDGQLEYLGRIDGQIKIRGQRLELGEIEHVLKSHASVDEGVALLSSVNEHNPHLTAFVTISNRAEHEGQLNDNPEASHTETWTELFEKDTYTSIEELDQAKLGRDFTGWTSMYDGENIDHDEMSEWLADGIQTILDDGNLGHVLEVGSGSGMMLFNIGEHLRSYTGIEPSRAAVNFIMGAANSVPSLSGKVRMILGTASDVNKVREIGSVLPDTLILNSVVQYFPSQSYLFEMIENLVQLGSARSIFIGDVRSFALYRSFLASRVLHMTKESKMSLLEVERMMDDMERAEKELLVDPAFFTGLPSRLPNIEHVEIIPKRMRTTNELSSYRYAVKIHLNVQGRQQLQVQGNPSPQWIDFEGQGLDRASLLDLLRQLPETSSGLCVANIPHEKTIIERHVTEALDHQRGRHQDDWLVSIYDQVKRRPSLSAMAIDEIAQEAGFRAKLSWARQNSQRGGFDVVFHRVDQKSSARPLFRFPTDHETLPTSSLANRPTWQQVTQSVREQIMELLKSQLPSYMVPRTVNVLDRMPINQNGKLDRKALEKLTVIPETKGRTTRPPRTDWERQMQGIWARMLNIQAENIGLDDSFFSLGGDSMIAMKVVGEARKLGIELTVADIFRLDTLEQLANKPSIQAPSTATESENTVLVEPSVKDALLAELDNLNTDIRSSEVADILPSTSSQERYVHDHFQFQHCFMYMLLGLGDDLDLERLKKSCATLVDLYPILRTRFFRLQGRIWQVVLQEVLLDIEVKHATEGSLNDSCHNACVEDQKSIRPTQLPTAFMIVRHETEGFGLAIRVQHAQYDAISLQIMLQSLHSLYIGIEPRKGPSFSRFLSHASNQRDNSLAYWKQLLAGSSSTVLDGKLGEVSPPDTEMVRTSAETIIPFPTVPGGKITPATIVSAAWAVLLSTVTGNTDVVYGNVASGRNSAIDNIQDIVAPCLNFLPFRARLSQTQTPAELFRSVQEQFLAVGEADSMGYKDIIQNATNWSGETEFGTVMQYMTMDERPEVNFEEAGARQTQLGTYADPLFVARSIIMMSYPRDDGLLLTIGDNSHIMSAAAGQKLVDGLGEIIRKMCGSLEVPLETCMSGFGLDLEA